MILNFENFQFLTTLTNFQFLITLTNFQFLTTLTPKVLQGIKKSFEYGYCDIKVYLILPDTL